MDMMKSLQKLLYVAFIASALVWTGCQRDENGFSLETARVSDYSSEVPLEWNKLYLLADRYAPGFRPGPAPRALGYMGLAAYEACISAMPDYNSLRGRYRAEGLDIPNVANTGEVYHWPTVVNATYGYLMRRFFPHVSGEIRFRIHSLEANFDNRAIAEIPRDVFERSKAYGQSVAEAVFNWSAQDHYGHEAFRNSRPSDYTPPSGPGMWQPTYPDFSGGLFPYWGKVRTFAITEEDKLALPPLPYSEELGSPFRQQAMEVYNKNTPVLSYEDQWIAEYWSDDTEGLVFSPPARFIAIPNQVLEHRRANLELALYTYLKVGLALNDAGVACWYSKYHYNVERPVSYIRRVVDLGWEPHLWFSPSFPAYPSGHATFGAAAAEVLSDIFGESYAMLDRSHEGRLEFLGIPRSFRSFREMAEENAYSRIPLGVHFRMDSDEGVRHGYAIGRRVNQLPIKK